MADSPSWLTDEAPGAGTAVDPVAAAPAAAPTPVSIDASANAVDTTNNSNSVDPDDKELPGIILVMRLANMGVSVALMACSILLMTSLPSLSNWVLAVYATCGGLLICCLETQLKFLRVMIAVNFGFLFNSVWRFMFYLLLGSVTWAYGSLFGRIIAVAMWVTGIMNTYILCRYPSYRAMRERIAEEEDKRIESRISKEVKKQAVSQLTGGR